jgi:hypothetical protein
MVFSDGMWSCTHAIPELWGQDGHEFKTSLGYIGGPEQLGVHSETMLQKKKKVMFSSQ